MDESWQMRMGIHGRKSMPEGPTTTTTTTTTRHSFTSTLDPDDFSDVFGGPPRTLLARKFSEDFNTTTSSTSSHFYAEIFRTPSPDFVSSTRRSGRVLPAFRIPAARGEGFYGDVFASNDGRKSRERSRPKSMSKSKSKSNSSSVLSSEELSPLRPVDGDDVALSSFASKLRPINVPCRWNSATMMPDEEPKRQAMPVFQCNRPSYTDNHYMENDHNYNFRSSYCGFSRRVSSPETISVEPNSYRSIKFSVDDLELNCPSSPASPASSLCQEPEPKTCFMHSNIVLEQEMEQEEDEVMSSYVIEINSDHREGTGEAVSIDEAIAWAKEKFQSQSSLTQNEKDESAADTESERPNANEILDRQMDGHETVDSSMEEPKDWTIENRKEQSEENMEMELSEEEIKLWSAGKETNIRLLLSTLHHVLWHNSGWYAVPLTSLIESSQVKKAYQKARLCLHPDKLQQRGATIQQKYISEKVFSVLQNAWAAFISEDVLF